MKPPGYQNSLFILPFDHRTSLLNILGVKTRRLTARQIKQVTELKKIIYDGFELTADKTIAKKSAAILVDEQFGDLILRDAKAKGYLVCLATEKSGQTEFDFEYGDKFTEHIYKYKPTMVKALIRYNPKGNKNLNNRQIKKLKKLSDWCHKNNYPFILEALVPPTKIQLREIKDNKIRYETEIRPKLMQQMIFELQAGRVEPDIWKVEGLSTAPAYKTIINQIRARGRENVSLVILGRGLNEKAVAEWLRIGGGINGVTGFAVGRTVWEKPLIDYLAGKIDKQKTAQQISQKYQHFYQIFTGQK